MQSIKHIKKPIVFVPMAADIFHHGHINILTKAKKFGNVIVGLMTDKGILSYKNKKPLISYKNRLKILNQIKSIDKVIPLNGLKYTQFAEFYKFDYFIHGDDWKKNTQSSQRKKLKLLMKKWKGKIIDIKYTKNISSSKIRKRLQKAKKQVYVGISADILHVGHINILKKAASLGDVTVGLLTNKAISSYKKQPLLNFYQRKTVIKNIRYVKKVIAQNSLDYSKNLNKLKPNYVVHGDDWKKGVQKKTRDKVIKTLKKWSGKLIEPSYTKKISSSLIKKNVLKLRKD